MSKRVNNKRGKRNVKRRKRKHSRRQRQQRVGTYPNQAELINDALFRL